MIISICNKRQDTNEYPALINLDLLDDNCVIYINNWSISKNGLNNDVLFAKSKKDLELNYFRKMNQVCINHNNTNKSITFEGENGERIEQIGINKKIEIEV